MAKKLELMIVVAPLIPLEGMRQHPPPDIVCRTPRKVPNHLRWTMLVFGHSERRLTQFIDELKALCPEAEVTRFSEVSANFLGSFATQSSNHN